MAKRVSSAAHSSSLLGAKRFGLRGLALLGLSALATSTAANEPLSAIEWLERRPAQIVTPLPAPQKIDEPPVADKITTPPIAVTALGAPERGAAGLLPSSVTGLPRTLWTGSDAQALSDRLGRIAPEGHPALLSLLYTLLLAEADAPFGAASERFLQARARKLISLGAIDPAQALLERAGANDPVLFPTYFDVTLLAGDAEPACLLLRAAPSVSRDLAARVYCDARAQKWDNAALTLATADAIGALPASDITLLEHFLDPELFGDTPLPDPPASPTPLQFRLFEAAGAPMGTASLPRAFANTGVSGNAGWKAQVEAAERLTRIGAISENRLLGIYTSHIPSASGGIWDRIEAVQRLETALSSGDPAAILKTARRAWDLLKAEGLGPAFAALFAEELLRLPAAGAQSDLVTHIALLSPLYEQAALRKTDDPRLQAAQAIAVGEAPRPETARLSAIARAFAPDAEAPATLVSLVRTDQLGDAILRAIELGISGANGDHAALTNALVFLRKSGLQDTARRHALAIVLSGPDT